MGNDLITTAEVARLLQVKPATVYAYVSRGFLAPAVRRGAGGSWFSREEVEAFRAGRARRRPPELRIDSALTLIDGGRFAYRGHDVLELAGSSAFERVAELLWTGRLPDADPSWEADEAWLSLGVKVQRHLAATAGPIDRLRLLVATLGPYVAAAPATATAPSLIASLVGSLPARAPGEGPSLAARVAARVSERPDPAVVAAVDVALVLLADHGLAPSTTAARLAAAYRADLCGVLGAGLAVLGGTWHGGASTRVEDLLRRMRDGAPVDRIVAATGTTAEATPGLGHPLYPDGDPRYRALRDHIAVTRPEAPVLDVLDRLEVAALWAGLPLPNVDCGLAALTLAFDLVPRSGELIFAVARTAGWVAHAIEAIHEKPLRLRAAYVGPEPKDHA